MIYVEESIEGIFSPVFSDVALKQPGMLVLKSFVDGQTNRQKTSSRLFLRSKVSPAPPLYLPARIELLLVGQLLHAAPLREAGQ
jgi:hypothetical protein